MYSANQLRQLFQNKFNLQEWTKFLISYFGAQTIRKTPELLDIASEEGKGYYLGQKKTTDNYEIGLFYLKLNSSVKKRRVGLRELIRPYLRYLVDAALVVFDDGDNWRLSFICDIKGENTAPKRYTFVFGDKNNYYNTAVNRFEKLQSDGIAFLTIKDAFSVEALTKEFYEKLFNWYLWAKDSKTGVTFPNNPQTVDDDRDKMEIKMIRLITRMLFVWFIKQKHLVPNYLFDTDYLKTILRDFDPLSSKQGNYYNAILQNLFFATLNQEQDKRTFIQPSFQGKGESYGVKTLYRDNQRQSWFTFPEDKKEEEVLKIFSSIPYLNGGLFECLDKFDLNENGKYRPITYYDGFSTHDKLSENKKNFKYRAFIPNELFFLDKPTKVTVETGEVQVIGLIELFKQYNFTVEENTTTDAEVSLDPELLGRVFENLLADYNPDTQQSARKSTGSYYTPREIVDYMVDESLKAYLTGECQNNKEEVDSLFADGKVSSFAVAEKINHDLRSVKVLDPACGSGAFPMGILLRITELIGHLEGEKFNRYETKLQLLKDCIYGIDIQAIAMLICKLRFFISLICDCEKDETKPNLGIIPLPNLETKFVAANSLMPAKVKEFDNDLLHDDDLQEMKERLLGLRKSILEVRHTRRKMEIRREDRKLCEQIQKYIIEQASKPDEEKIARLRNVIEECEAELPKYKEDYWVDEMVTQASLFDTGEPTIFRRNINKEKRDELNARIRSAQADIRREENKTTQDGFFEAVKQVTNWDPYDQNADSPFFDAEWMFGIGISRPSKQGFDIVIGNPPYMNVAANSEYKQLTIYNEIADGVVNMASLFLYFSINSLADKQGVVSMIIPKSYYTVQSWNKIRSKNLSQCSLISVNDVGKAFENVGLEQGIVVYSKIYDPNNTVKVLNEFEEVNQIPQTYFHDKNIVLTYVTEEIFGVINTIEQSASYLGDIADMPRGITENSSVYSEYKRVNDIQILGGTNIKQYSITDGNKRKPNRYVDKNLGSLVARKNVFSLDRICYQNLMSSLPKVVATIVPGNVPTDDTINNIVFKPNNTYHTKLILAILNSQLCTFFLKYRLFNCAKLTVHLDKPYMGNIPLPAIENIDILQQPIVELVDTILEKKKQNPQTDTSVEENAIDQLVYQLYGLSREEIRIIEKG